jgi:DNA modification methylase
VNTWRILHGDVREQIASLPDGCVQTCVTSPPYFGLRDYGHAGQIGLEPTPEAFVAALVAVFREVRRVLADDGTLWLNLGDSYAGYWGDKTAKREGRASSADTNGWTNGFNMNNRPSFHTAFDGSGIKPKDLIGIPWRVAFALQADGWYLRSDIIWSKPNPMPESVTDRPTKAHEYIFLLSKSARYFYDADAIQEQSVTPIDTKAGCAFGGGKRDDVHMARSSQPGKAWEHSTGRNKRSVWHVATQPYSGAHFATFPEALIEPCILAGSRPAGKRCDCDEVIATPTGSGPIEDPTMDVGRAGFSRPRRPDEGIRPITRRQQRSDAAQLRALLSTASDRTRADIEEICGPGLDHYIRTDSNGARPLPPAARSFLKKVDWLREPEPCDCPVMPADTVLDPFTGSGTTGAVAIRHQRNFIGCELNADYIRLAEKRIRAVAPLFSDGHVQGAGSQSAATPDGQPQGLFL